MPFEDKTISGKKGLKINNSKSSVITPKSDKEEEIAFERSAKEELEKQEEYKSRWHELGPRFRSIIENRVLSQNKSLITKDLEQEALNKIILLVNEMNTDINQPDAYGATSLLMLIMKMMIVQRDTINNLSFKIEQMEKNVLLEKTTDANKK
jgi:hypothetical protein